MGPSLADGLRVERKVSMLAWCTRDTANSLHPYHWYYWQIFKFDSLCGNLCTHEQFLEWWRQCRPKFFQSRTKIISKLQRLSHTKIVFHSSSHSKKCFKVSKTTACFCWCGMFQSLSYQNIIFQSLSHTKIVFHSLSHSNNCFQNFQNNCMFLLIWDDRKTVSHFCEVLACSNCFHVREFNQVASN